MPTLLKTAPAASFIKEWQLPPAATLGSSVRCKGILNEVRSRLPARERKSLAVAGSALLLSMPEGSEIEFERIAAIISEALHRVEALRVIPRELEDVLAISTTERHRWLKDGRLRSAGTRTVRLPGRSKTITFHVFDPRHVEDILNADLVATWREDDAVAAAERRRTSALIRALSRREKSIPSEAGTTPLQEGPRPLLKGWEEFDREGLLR
jgi:hypothetical protein